MKQIFIFFVVLISYNASQAQQVETAEAPAAPAPQQTSSAPMTASDSLKLAISNAKTAFADISKLFSRKSDTMLIVIPEIDYDNSSLAQLKECLKKAKGVRSVTTHYNASTATLEVAYKGKPNEVWDMLPAYSKAAFKLTEFGANTISLQYKQKTP